VKPTELLDYVLELTSSRLRSHTQWQLFDPSLQALSPGMEQGETLSIDVEMIGELVAQSEIDFRSLKENVRSVLSIKSQASVREVLETYPAAQGLGSIVGLIALGSRHGVKGTGREAVTWTGRDQQSRSARIPTIYFVKERVRELV
jgi:hypothetical protein